MKKKNKRKVFEKEYGNMEAAAVMNPEEFSFKKQVFETIMDEAERLLKESGLFITDFSMDNDSVQNILNMDTRYPKKRPAVTLRYEDKDCMYMLNSFTGMNDDAKEGIFVTLLKLDKNTDDLYVFDENGWRIQEKASPDERGTIVKISGNDPDKEAFINFLSDLKIKDLSIGRMEEFLRREAPLIKLYSLMKGRMKFAFVDDEQEGPSFFLVPKGLNGISVHQNNGVYAVCGYLQEDGMKPCFRKIFDIEDIEKASKYLDDMFTSVKKDTVTMIPASGSAFLTISADGSYAFTGDISETEKDRILRFYRI